MPKPRRISARSTALAALMEVTWEFLISPGNPDTYVFENAERLYLRGGYICLVLGWIGRLLLHWLPARGIDKKSESP